MTSTPIPDGPTVSLVLGAGGARGLAHIGVIEVLEERGYRIRSIAGSSMGALVGGMHAAGRLREYKEWAVALERLDVLRLVDWTLSGGGFIKGERVIQALSELVGSADIESLPVAYTAVATDLDRQCEVWLSRGPLFDAIRASISIPGLFRPHYLHGRTLVDGGLLNPLPLAPTLRDLTDLTVAVDVNGPEQDEVEPEPVGNVDASGYAERVSAFIEGLIGKRDARPDEPGWRDLLSRSFETVQGALTRHTLATHRPDVMIQVPRNQCAFYEFHRANELVQLGRERAESALAAYRVHHG